MAAYVGYHLLVPEGITDEETAKVAELKGLIEAKFELSEEENIVNHPPWLLRFHRAREGDVGKAAGTVRQYAPQAAGVSPSRLSLPSPPPSLLCSLPYSSHCEVRAR